MSATVEAPAENGHVETLEDPTADGWRKDTKGRFYIPRQGKSGIIYRQPGETPDEARARDAKGPKDRRPKSPKSKVPKAPAPTRKSLQEIEFGLTELLKAPSFATALQGDEWATAHFDREAPVLARNLVAAAQHNPWLLSKLEAMITGEGIVLMKILAFMPVLTAAIAYAAPPIIYYLDPGFIPPEARDRFNVPRRPSSETRRLLREERKRELEEAMKAEQAAMDAINEEMNAAAAPAPAPEPAESPDQAGA